MIRTVLCPILTENNRRLRVCKLERGVTAVLGFSEQHTAAAWVPPAINGRDAPGGANSSAGKARS